MNEVNNHLLFAQPIPRNPGHFLTIANVVETIAEVGEDKAKLHAAVRQFAAQGYLYAPYRETGARGAYLYTHSTCIVGAVLLRLIEMGIRDKEACRVVASVLYGDSTVRAGATVIQSMAAGDRDWTLELWTLRSDTGRVVHDARLYKPAMGRGPDLNYDLSKFTMRAVLAIDLADVIDRMCAKGVVN
mgnify:CR=1 FL=1